jgi:radical SAM superfamily enzyme YgiQ (UPF0313 family)
MKTWICTTLANFWGPQQGPARLYAYIRQQKHNVSFIDANQDTYFALMTRQNLYPVMEKLKNNVDSISRNRFLRQNISSILLNSSQGSIKQLIAKGITRSPSHIFLRENAITKNVLFNFIKLKITGDNLYYALLSEQEFVIDEIEKASNVLDKRFFSLPAIEVLRNFYTLLCGKALIDAAYFPAQLDFGLGFYGTAYGPYTADIIRAVEDEKYNYLIPYYKNRFVPLINSEQPELVGISITHMSEFVSGFTLAHLIKSVNPQIHITLGGALVTEVADRIARNPALWDMFDSLVIGPGEYAFSELIECLEKKADLSNVPNVIYKQKDNIKSSEKSSEFDINDACTPEYVNVRPQSGLPLETASGCYWGKCIFCFYPRQGTAGLYPEMDKKRIRNMELVLEDVRKLRDNYHPVAIGFTDSAMPPGRIEQIAEYNLKNEKPVKFFSFIRFEKEFKSEAFCQKLVSGGFLGGQVGLESGSQRVNDIINKGVDLHDAEIILRNFKKTGILIHVYTICGLPGEKPEEAAMTFNFLKRWHKLITLDWQIYPMYVMERSPIADRADEFGIKTTKIRDDVLLQIMFYEMKDGMNQEQSMSTMIGYNEKLKDLLNPLHKIMDIESLKMFLLAQYAKGNRPDKLKIGKIKA